MYKLFLRPILFLFDPERIHHATFWMLGVLLSIPGMGNLFSLFFGHRGGGLQRKVFGLTFKNPLGLAAGFDKDALLAHKWRYFGFGFVEVGTVTPKPQEGNPKQRLFRLPQDGGVINRMGFNNAGVDAMVKRLRKRPESDIIIGANIGKNKDTPNEKAVEDYLICFEKLFDYVDYFVVNVSSPNTPGLRDLQEKEPLKALLWTLQDNNNQRPKPKPILLKISPDLNEDQLDDVMEVVRVTGIAGLIAANTTLSRASLITEEYKVKMIGKGGLSGRPLTARSTEIARYIRKKSNGTIDFIGVGGIMSAKDAKARLAEGASLIQVYTGFVYGGPGWIKKILKSL